MVNARSEGGLDGLLERTHAAVLACDASRPPSHDLERLASLLESHLDAHVASCVHQLPQEILLRISQLVKVPHELGVDTRDEKSEEPAKDVELSRSYKALAQPLLALSVPLVRLLATSESEDPPSQALLRVHATLYIASTKLRQPDFASLFSSPELSELSTRLTSLLVPTPATRLALLSHLLRVSLPIHFKPHPKLNPSSGRVLNRPLGGPNGRGTDEWSEGADDSEHGWKREVGLSGTVLAIIEDLHPQELEDLWPWVLPPLLAYLDDFTTSNKILGLHLLDRLLDKLSAVPAGASSLLVRTGVGKVFQQVEFLLSLPVHPAFTRVSTDLRAHGTSVFLPFVVQQSLVVIFSNLSDPLSLRLQSLAQPASLKLVDLVYPPPAPLPALAPRPPSRELVRHREQASRLRFDALCAHFAQTTLQTWQYKSGHFVFELLQLSPTRPRCLARPAEDEAKRGEGEGEGKTTRRRTYGPGLIEWFASIEGGVVRYLGILVPHVTGLLHGDGGGTGLGQDAGAGGEDGLDQMRWSRETVELRTRAVRALRALYAREDWARARMTKWEPVVASAVAKCWVAIKDRGDQEVDGLDELENNLKGLVDDARALSSEGDTDCWQDLRTLDPIFEDLVRAR